MVLDFTHQTITMNFLGAFLGGFFYQYTFLNSIIVIWMLVSAFYSGMYLQKRDNVLEKYSHQFNLKYKICENKFNTLVDKVKKVFGSKSNDNKNGNMENNRQNKVTKIYTDDGETVLHRKEEELKAD